MEEVIMLVRVARLFTTLGELKSSLYMAKSMATLSSKLNNNLKVRLIQ